MCLQKTKELAGNNGLPLHPGRTCPKRISRGRLRKHIDNFNIAQGAASSIEQNLKDLEGKIAASEKMKLEAMIKEIKDITNHQDIQTVTPEIGKELKEKADALTEEAQNVFASVYQNNYTKDNQPKEEDSDTEGSGDEVIYGKFKEV